jgi:flagellar protein FlaG
VDIPNLTKTGPVSAQVVDTVGNSFGKQSSATIGNSLPDAGQSRARVEGPLAANPVFPSNPEELNKLVAQANATLQNRSSDLKFTVAEGADVNVVRIEDAETGELIRQIPSEAVVAITRALDEVQRGTMFEEEA